MKYFSEQKDKERKSNIVRKESEQKGEKEEEKSPKLVRLVQELELISNDSQKERLLVNWMVCRIREKPIEICDCLSTHVFSNMYMLCCLLKTIFCLGWRICLINKPAFVQFESVPNMKDELI